MPTPLYSPNQILAVAFIGGPVATVLALKHNYDALGNAVGAELVVRWGIAFVIALLSLIPFVPQDFPQMVIPLAYSFAARGIAEGSQRSREQIAEDEGLAFMPTGQLLRFSLIHLVLFMVLSVGWMLALDHFGIIDLPEPPAAAAPANP